MPVQGSLNMEKVSRIKLAQVKHFKCFLYCSVNWKMLNV